MGEYAEMMLDGTCCEGCGAFIGEATGFPGYCSAECARDRGAAYFNHGKAYPAKDPDPVRVRCPLCRKRVKQSGLWQHKRDVHGIAPSYDGVSR